MKYACMRGSRRAGRTHAFITQLLVLKDAGKDLGTILVPNKKCKQMLIDAGIPEDNILNVEEDNGEFNNNKTS